MSWKWSAVAAGIGLLSFATGLWLISVLCFGYLAYRLIGAVTGSAPGRRTIGRDLRLAAGVALVSLSGVAYLLGGVASPVVFLLAGVLLLASPALTRLSPSAALIPVEGSILLRSRLIPYHWASLAELKPGPEPLPRGAAACSGTLLVFTGTRRVYSVFSCWATSRSDAEAKVVGMMRRSFPRTPSSAYLYPLDSRSASEVLSQNLSRAGLQKEDPVGSATRADGCLALECDGGSVAKVGAYAVEGPARRSRVPRASYQVSDRPLIWELLDSVGRRNGWPDPDPVSDLLDSLAATRGVPLSERLSSLRAQEEGVEVVSVAGRPVQVTRPQLRAILAIYQ